MNRHLPNPALEKSEPRPLGSETSNPIKILADATLPDLADLFLEPFVLTLYQTSQQLSEQLLCHDVLICRSTLRIDAKLLKNSTITCIATASSGVDHIDDVYLNEHNIQLFHAKGSNARAVADYVVSILATLHALGKSIGNRAGVIGVGEVGSRVTARLQAAGYNVMCYDPLKASLNTNFTYSSLNEVATCDLLCIHSNLHESQPFPSKHLLNARFLAQLKPNVTIINAARGGIVDEDALLATSKPITYCTDVYDNEPNIDPRIVDFSTLCTPHIAGHSKEAKQAAVVQISQQLHDFYGLTMPSIHILSSIDHLIGQSSHNWQDYVLSLYNSLNDTQILKGAIDKKNAFLTQRKAHSRHDFNAYATQNLNPQSRLLLGF